jgi:hypothetical protein
MERSVIFAAENEAVALEEVRARMASTCSEQRGNALFTGMGGGPGVQLPPVGAPAAAAANVTNNQSSVVGDTNTETNSTTIEKLSVFELVRWAKRATQSHPGLRSRSVAAAHRRRNSL